MAHYVVRVKGTLSNEVVHTYPSMTADEESAQTILYGDLMDQAALAGLLNHLNMLGSDILEVRQVPPDQGASSD